MPRDLAQKSDNRLVVNDLVSESKITLLYRLPTAEEHLQYHKDVNLLVDGKLEYDENARLDHAEKMLTGFRTGDLVLDGKAISCIEGDENYRADWKKLIRESAADWLLILATVVFQGSRREARLPFGTSSKE